MCENQHSNIAPVYKQCTVLIIINNVREMLPTHSLTYYF